jgi:uncharacterized protein YceK
MRLIVLLVIAFMLSGCSAMLVGGSAESEKRSDCTESEKEAEERGC